jgi:hypothetical protein
MKKRNLIILTVLASSLIFVAVCLFCVLFWVWYSQTHTGSRSGQVFDAITGKPIQGAVVKYTWRTIGFLEDAIGGGGSPVSHETLTDKEGKYKIPNLRVKRESLLETGLSREEVIIYKDGYARYIVFDNDDPQVGRSFGYSNYKQNYQRKNNNVKLYPWKEGESHDAHFNSIDWRTSHYSGQGELLRKELEPEKNRAQQERAAKRRQK